ncbi:hypothetical protein H6F39_17525 [Anabaena sp. FACHB-1250]|uniref:Uncharacterized protein n=1 Tax=Dolichospermum flos-aquae LEGE 04289 TaxID=1828708 RepID=A0ACC5Q293_DOLFA|nr:MULTISPECIES: hypothetical protein [Nostocales]MBD2143103.1 hypothetical protein [Anabaena sp. FACHB-1250]MBE9219204.1 hypothetical protein [Dolichospermum flos-aquae LEGE 04289]
MTSIEKSGMLDTDEEELSSLYKHDKTGQDELGTALGVSAREKMIKQ